jgi:hypothetical protein
MDDSFGVVQSIEWDHAYEAKTTFFFDTFF